MTTFSTSTVYSDAGEAIGIVIEHALQGTSSEGVLLWKQDSDGAYAIHRTHANALTGSGHYFGPWSGENWREMAFTIFGDMA